MKIAEYRNDPTYLAAQGARDTALERAIRVIDIARRAPSAEDAPTVAHIRSPGATSVKSRLYQFTNRDIIKEGDTPGVLSITARHVLKWAITTLEGDRGAATNKSLLRLDATIQAFQTALDDLEAAETALRSAEEAWKSRDDERFTTNKSRGHALESYGRFVATTYDICDNLNVPYKSANDKVAYNPGYERLYGLLAQCCLTARNERFNTVIGSALNAAERGRWTRACVLLDDATDLFPLE